MQTALMEMGAPPAAKDANVDTWISARQYTGRLVSVTNDKLFDTPVYNYTRAFPYMWDEMPIPIKYGADWQGAESILLDVARRHTGELVEKAKPALETLREKFVIALDIDLEPKAYVRLTDNWIEMTLGSQGPCMASGRSRMRWGGRSCRRLRRRGWRWRRRRMRSWGCRRSGSSGTVQAPLLPQDAEKLPPRRPAACAGGCA